MANQLKMAEIHTIQTLHQSGYSGRRIATVLDVDRGTVAKYIAQVQNPPNAPTGLGGGSIGGAGDQTGTQERVRAVS